MSTNVVTVAEARPRSVVVAMSDRYGMEPAAFEATVRATCMPSNVNVSREQFAAFLLVAKEYRLNPLTKEIYAFPAKGGGIQPIVGIDGWSRIINERPELDGIEFEDHFDEGKLAAITCKISRKDRALPVCVTEYMAECRRGTDTWKQWPARMLRHKAMIQCARYAFGFSGIMDPDEYERMSEARNVTPERPDLRTRLPGASQVGGFSPSHVEAEIDAATEATFEHIDPETGEIIDPNIDPPADDDFPGDKPLARAEAEPNKPASEGSPLTIEQRVAAFKKRVDEAPGTVKLKGIWTASAALRNDAGDELAADMEAYWNAAFAVHEDKERRGE